MVWIFMDQTLLRKYYIQKYETKIKGNQHFSIFFRFAFSLGKWQTQSNIQTISLQWSGFILKTPQRFRVFLFPVPWIDSQMQPSLQLSFLQTVDAILLWISILLCVYKMVDFFLCFGLFCKLMSSWKVLPEEIKK